MSRPETRRESPPTDWPESKTVPCQWCKQPCLMVRKGDGVMFRGRPNYWWNTDHDCAERKAAGKALGATHRKMLRALGGV